MAQGAPRSGSGLILGAFSPPHRGHRYLVDFARHFADHLTVHVLARPGDSIPAQQRCEWLADRFPGTKAGALHLPAAAAEALPASALSGLRGSADFLFSNDREAGEWARLLHCRWIPVDHLGEVFPHSGAELRGDAPGHWEAPPHTAPPGIVRRVCIMGAESVGKSWLARELAARFSTVFVPEYARTLVDAQDNQVDFTDSAVIARGHIAAEEALARQANHVLFCDTGTLSTVIWCDVLYGRCYPWIRRWADRRRYDLVLLLRPDVPWQPDPQRSLATEEERRAFHERCRGELETRGWRYVEIGGSWEERRRHAEEEVEALLREGKG